MCRQFDSGPRHFQNPIRNDRVFLCPRGWGWRLRRMQAGGGCPAGRKSDSCVRNAAELKTGGERKAGKGLVVRGMWGYLYITLLAWFPPSPMSVHVRMMPLTDGAKASSFGLNLIYNAKHTTRTESQHTVFHHRTSIDVFRLLRPCRRTNHFGMRMATVFFGFQVHLSAGFA